MRKYDKTQKGNSDDMLTRQLAKKRIMGRLVNINHSAKIKQESDTTMDQSKLLHRINTIR